MTCLTAVTRGYMLSVDARCDCNDDSGRLVIRSGDSVGIRLELPGGDVLPAIPVGAAWRAFDWSTRLPITDVTEFVPSEDMAFVVTGLVHDGRASDLRKVAVEIVIRFNADGDPEDIMTAVIEVWVRKRFGSFIPGSSGGIPEEEDDEDAQMEFIPALLEGVTQ